MTVTATVDDWIPLVTTCSVLAPVSMPDGTSKSAVTELGLATCSELKPCVFAKNTWPVELFTITTSRPLMRGLTLGLEYDGTYERALSNGALDSQWLRRISLGYSISDESTFNIGLRDINGYGGFATQIGNNLAIGFHQRFASGNELYVNYGSPAAGATLNRLIVKFVFHAGADTGT